MISSYYYSLESMFLMCFFANVNEFIKKETPTQGLSYEFCGFFQNISYIEHLL